MRLSLISSLPSLTAAVTALSTAPFEPNQDSAHANAANIFNAVHSAGRLWGSSLNHNGFGFFPAVMPAGTILYHGSWNATPPQGFEWLAFELEHAEIFGFSSRLRKGEPWPPIVKPPEKPQPSHRDDGIQIPMGGGVRQSNDLSELGNGDDGDDYIGNVRSYMHTYQTTRDLHLLYIDGMAAAKSDKGTLDSQDLLLRENKYEPIEGGDPVFDEAARAKDLCAMATEWGYDGIVRVEIGFEVIKCDFIDGMEQICANRSPMPEDSLGDFSAMPFLTARSAVQLYDGVGGDRLRIDFSSTVSGFFFPINVSSTNANRPDLIRLGATPLDELRRIKMHLAEISKKKRRFTVNWQAIVDRIVTRFADRLALMASDQASAGTIVNELEKSVVSYYAHRPLPDDLNLQSDYMTEEQRLEDAISECTTHYLRPAEIHRKDWHFEDQLLLTALTAVTGDICSTLLNARSSLLKQSRIPDNDTGYDKTLSVVRAEFKSLLGRLAWTEWRKTRPCPLDELEFVVMFPLGLEEDYWNPGCRTIEEMRARMGYWVPQ